MHMHIVWSAPLTRKIGPYMVENHLGSSDMAQSMAAKLTVSAKSSTPGPEARRAPPPAARSPWSRRAEALNITRESTNQIAK